MPATMDMTAWSSTLLGLFTLFAGVGALRNPAMWRTAIQEVNNSSALQLTTGLLELVVGAAIYLSNAWIPSDVLACVLKAIGGLMMLEALAVVGFCDVYTNFWPRSLIHMHRVWAMLTVLVGLAFSILGMLRFG